MAPRVEGVVLLATAHEPEALLEAFFTPPWITGARHPDLELGMGRVEDVPVVLRVLPEDEAAFAAQQLWMTARQDHFAALVRAADARGLLLDPNGLWRGDERLPLTTEVALYETLDLPYFPAELREGSDLQPPPTDLVEMADIRGVAGIHTDAGAGRHTLAQMAERAQREGYGWMVVADESVDTAQVQAIERLASEDQTPLRILTARDVPEDVLEVCGGANAEPLPAAAHEEAREQGLRALVSAGARDLVGIDDAICAVGALRRARWRKGEVLSALEVDEVLG